MGTPPLVSSGRGSVRKCHVLLFTNQDLTALESERVAVVSLFVFISSTVGQI